MKKLNMLFVTILSLGLFFASCEGEDGLDGINGQDGVDGQDGADGADGEDGEDAITEMMIDAADLLLTSIATDGGTPFDADNPAVDYPEEANVFFASVLGVDYTVDRNVAPEGPTVRLPLFQGWEMVDGTPRELYYVITEASNKQLARELGVIYAPRMANAVRSGGDQGSTWSDDGRLVFEGTVDLHDRVPHGNGTSSEQEDNLANPNLDADGAAVVLQLLDGWHNGRPYYFHIVTDTSDPGPATIELGVFAPRLANLPSFGNFPGGSMLPFSPTVNGRGDTGDGLFQGLNIASLSNRQTMDPTNTFPIDPRDPDYAPMWDAHLTEFTVPAEERVILRSFDQINELLEVGTLIPFRGNLNEYPASNSLSDLLTAAGAIINCPVISQPFASAIGQQYGNPTN